MSTFHIKHGADGHLMHGPDGHLADGCGSGEECACFSVFPCADCPDITPSQFHVTFAGITLCSGCVSCDSADCAWTIAATSVPCTGTIYGSTDCSGDSAPIGFAVQQVRVSGTQFEIQITDDSNTVLLFNATIDAAKCCAGYTVANALTACGCDGITDAIFALGTGGTATVTPC
jgi:hypothetical protein